MLDVLRGVIRGSVTWAIGYVLTALVVAVGIVGTTGGFFGGTARTYLAAHTLSVDPAYLLLIPVAALALGGYRTGTSLRTGVAGRLRAAIQSVRGTERNRIRTAATAGGLLAVGYALVGAVVALSVGVSPGSAAVRSLVFGLVVAVPSAVLGAYDWGNVR